MGEVVSLRRRRKAKARSAAEAEADANRAVHGRTRAEVQSDAADKARRDALLDGAKRED